MKKGIRNERNNSSIFRNHHTERKAYTKARERAEEKYNELDERIKSLEKSEREKKLSDEKLKREIETLKKSKIAPHTRHRTNVIPFEQDTE